MKTGSRLAIIIFSLVAITHLLRLVFGIPIVIGEWNVPQWVSILGVLVPGLVAWLLWQESK